MKTISNNQPQPTPLFASREASLVSGFELNTDASLIQTDWSDYLDLHDQRYGLAIAHFKTQIRGRSYDNDAMRIRVGKNGFYVQSRQLPIAFYADSVEPDVRFITENEARAVVWEASALYRADEAQSLVMVYHPFDPPEVFFGYRMAAFNRFEMGTLQTGLPMHMRVVIDAEESTELVNGKTGVVVYQQTKDGRHLLLTSHGRRQPFASSLFL